MPEERASREWDAARYERERRGFIESRSLRRPITLHAVLIFTVTGVVGWATSFLLLKAGAANMPLRYAASFLVAYLAFALSVRVWSDFMRQERGSGAGWDGSGLDLPLVDSEGCLFVVGIFVAALILAGLFTLLGGVPLLLDVAFEVVFAGVMVRRLGRVEKVGDWSGKLVRSTWLPALVIALVLVSAAGWLQHKAPEARTLVQAVKLLGAK